MLDIGFTEILLIGVVALIVIGPEKLPSVVRTGLGYFRRFKRSASALRSDLERELALEDLKKELERQKEGVKSTLALDDVKHSLGELNQEVKGFEKGFEQGFYQQTSNANAKPANENDSATETSADKAHQANGMADNVAKSTDKPDATRNETDNNTIDTNVSDKVSDEVSNKVIAEDLAALADEVGPHLPDADAEAGTGIEGEAKGANPNAKTDIKADAKTAPNASRDSA